MQDDTAKHTWFPARSKTSAVVLRFIKGQLHQLWVSREARQSKWKKISKEVNTDVYAS